MGGDKKMTFMDRAVAGEIGDNDLVAEVDREVERWHRSDGDDILDLHEFLGMTLSEYARWIGPNSWSLRKIVEARRQGKE